MPAGDGTGPLGMGPMTGRRAGICAGFGVPGYANPGAGFWCGGGRGRGFRNRYLATGVPGWAWWPSVSGAVPAPVTAENEAEVLRQQAAALQRSLDAINQRLANLTTEK